MGSVLSQWHQGDFVPVDAHASLGLDLAGSRRLLVTPYSCALAHADAASDVDFLILTPIKRDPAKDFRYGKSARCIHVLAEDAGIEQWFEATPGDRRVLKAATLASIRVDNSIRLLDQQREALSYWLAQRFIRSALPDEFNQALAPAIKKLRGVFEGMPACYVVLVNFAQNEEGKYRAKFILVLDAHEKDQLANLQSAAVEMERLLLKCPRIEAEATAELADAVSLQTFKDYKHFDAFDDVSMADGHVGPLHAAKSARRVAVAVMDQNLRGKDRSMWVQKIWKRLQRACAVLFGSED